MNFLITVVTLAGWALWGYTVLLVDPSVPMAPIAFYATLFIALTGSLARLLGGGGSVDADGAFSSKPNLGHAAVVTTLILFAMWLQSLRMLTALNGTLLATTFLLIELGFFLTGGRRRPRARRRPRRVTVPEPHPTGDQ